MLEYHDNNNWTLIYTEMTGDHFGRETNLHVVFLTSQFILKCGLYNVASGVVEC